MSPIAGSGFTCLGVHEVLVLITVDELETTAVPGTFDVFETDDSSFIGGNLSVDHGDWRLSGFIGAGPCPALDRSGP